MLSDELRFTVRVTPRAGLDRVDGVGPNGELRVRVRAAPADGAANASVLRTIADAAHVAPSLLDIERGHTGRLKLVSASGRAAQAISTIWPALQTTAD